MFTFLEATGELYQGQFGKFTVTRADRLGVVIYRGALLVAALSVAVAALLALSADFTALTYTLLSVAFTLFALALGVALLTIHIYLSVLHRALQVFWAIGCLAALWISWHRSSPLALAVYGNGMDLLAVGWLFVALTGLYIKEAFCFNHWETKVLTGILPLLFGGHWLHLLTPMVERGLLLSWAVLFLVFAARKLVQPIPPDIGDKSVFEYLHHSAASRS
jgi:uncharacterized integral membrane protein